MSDLTQWLDSSESPWIGLSIVSEDDEKWSGKYLYGNEGKRVVRVLRGRKMVSLQGLMNEFGAALQFFQGFGENWYALNECLCYLDEWLPGDAYVLVVPDAHMILGEADMDEFMWLLVTLDEVGEWWSKPVVDNDRFNRPPVPFRVLLKCSAVQMPELQARVSRAVSASGRQISIWEQPSGAR